MRLLLDTHAFVFWDNGTLPAAVTKQIKAADEIFVSAVSAWEIAIKSALGKIDVKSALEPAIAEYGFNELPISIRHADQTRTLPAHHRDPFDRLLIAQARVEELVIVTRDPVFAKYDVRITWG